MKDIETGEEIVFDTYISLEDPYGGQIFMELETFREEKRKYRGETGDDNSAFLFELQNTPSKILKEKFFILEYHVIREYEEKSESEESHSVFISKTGPGFKKTLEYLMNKKGITLN